jgi:ATP-dependent RNA helicase DDX35
MEEPCSDLIGETVETIMKIHQNEASGDILAFLHGKEEVDTVVTLLADRGSEYAYI